MNPNDYHRTPPPIWGPIKQLAREMRHALTPAEDRLWQALRGHQLVGAHFRRQHSIDRFIVDFYCHAARLVVEVDGDIHQYTVEEDALRQAYLESLGLRVIRFHNDEVLHQLLVVLARITEKLREPY